MRAEAPNAPTTTGMSYLRPLESTTLVNRNARRASSARPPWNCQRTSGWISVSLSIGRSTRTTRPCASRAARCCWKSDGGPPADGVAVPRALSLTSSIAGPHREYGGQPTTCRNMCAMLKVSAHYRPGATMTEHIRMTREGAVAAVTIDRTADGNVLNLDMLRAL